MGCGSSAKVAVDVEATASFTKFKQMLNKNKVTDLYEPGRQLGSGNMATVYLYTRISNRKEFAAKVVIKNTLGATTEFTNELEILNHLKGHSQILELEDVFEDKSSFYLITDLVEGGELFDRICSVGQYTEGIAKKLCVPILKALKFIHDKKIIHRDIKPENLLLMNNSPDAALKIADFGVATWMHELSRGAHKYQKCGTPEYMAPEMYASSSSPYGTGVDVWALGCVMYIMLCGWHPFQDTESFEKQRDNIRDDDLSELNGEQLSDNAKDFLLKMLTKDPEKRWTIPQIMQHPWLADATSDNRPLVKQQEKLRKYQNLRRFRKVSFAVLAATRASKLAAFN